MIILTTYNKYSKAVAKLLFIISAGCSVCCYALESTKNQQAEKTKKIVAINQDISKVIHFDIPSQRLHSALELFCQQSGLQFLTAEPHIATAMGNQLLGDYSVVNGLDILLKDSGYFYEFISAELINIHSIEQTAEHSTLEEVVVSVRFHRERLVDSPIAVTKIQIDGQNSRSFSDLTDTTRLSPNVDFSFGGTSSGSTSAAVMYIRGIGQNDFTPVTDPGVGVYLDGVYLGRTVGSVAHIGDLESIQVLRGPQGTLFGRNTIGGAILMESRSVGDQYRLWGKLSAGNEGYFSATVNANLPIEDTIGFTGSYVSRRMDSYVSRPLAGDGLGNEHTDSTRAKFNWSDGGRHQFALAADYTRERESSAAEILTQLYTESDFIRAHNNVVESENPGVNCTAQQPVSLFENMCLNRQFVTNTFFSYETGPSRNDMDVGGLSLTWDFTVNDYIDVRSISAYRSINANFSRSADGTPVTIIQTQDSYDQEQLSQELRVLGSNRADNLFWVAGLFFMEERAENFSTIETTLPLYPIYFGGDTDNSNYAVFFEGTYHFYDTWSISLGLRQTHEHKIFLPTSVSIATGTELIAHEEGDLVFDELNWRTALMYYPNDSSSVYLTLSTGFKSGGFVHRYFVSSPDGLITFKPEYVTQYELGYKTSMLPEQLQFSAMVFYNDYKNIQTAANPTGQPATITDNAAQGHVMGLEAELLWALTSNMVVEGSLGLLSAEYDDIGSDNITVSVEDDFIRAPSTSINLALSYTYPLQYGEINFRVDWALRSRIEFEPDNDPYVSEPGYQVVDTRFTYQPDNANWNLQFGINNLTDKRYMIAGDSNREFGYALAVFSRPRNYYLSMNWEI